MSNERERVYLDLHKNFVKEDIPGSDGRAFNSVVIPGGVMIDGQDVGGYKFFPLYVNESQRSANWRTIPLLADRDIQLGRTRLDKDGQPLLDEHGERIIDVVHVKPHDLVAAVEAEREAYREEHPREVVWVNVHRSFVADRGHFLSVGLAPNTIIDGRDYGNYRFTVTGAHPSQYNENVLGIPLDPARNYKLTGGEKFADSILVKGIVLKEAIEAARAAYRAEHAAERTSTEREAGEDPIGDLDDEIGSAVAASEAARDSWHHDEREEVPMELGR